MTEIPYEPIPVEDTFGIIVIEQAPGFDSQVKLEILQALHGALQPIATRLGQTNLSVSFVVQLMEGGTE